MIRWIADHPVAWLVGLLADAIGWVSSHVG